MLTQVARTLLAGVVVTAAAVAQQPTPPRQQAKIHAATHATAGIIKLVDLKAGKLTIATPAAVEQAFKFDAKTIVRGLEGAKQVKALVGKEGASVVVHFTGEATEALAVAVEYLGQESLQVAEGSVVRFDRKARTIAIKTTGGTEETFQLGLPAPIDLPTGIVPLAAFSPKPDEKVVLTYTEKGKDKIVRLLKLTESEVSLK